MDFFTKLKLPRNVKKAYIKTTLNGKPLDETLFGQEVGNGYYRNGIILERVENGFAVETRTVENAHFIPNSFLEFDEKGNFKSGSVNCFSFGWLQADRYYVEEMLQELVNREDFKWDDIQV